MQRSLPALIALILLFSTVGWSADFEKGLEAYMKEDYATALRELKPLAKEGHQAAQFHLGFMYAKGKGVPQNDKTAAKWYRLTAGQGDIDAQNNLGLMYGLGRGVSKSDVYAYMWLNIAALQGNKKAAGLRDILAKEMGSSQIEKAQDLASDCVEKKYKGCD